MKPVFKTFTTYKHYYMYDRNRNSILEISKEDYELLLDIESGKDGPQTKEVLQRFRDQGYLLDSTVKTVKQPCSDFFEEYIDRKTEKMTLQLTQNCNLRCDYCAYSGNYNNRTHSNRNMDFETARKAIDYLYAHSCEKERVVIAFYGGEPLLRMDLIKQCVAYVDDHYSEKDVYYTLTTNGTLLTDEIVDYLFAHDINIMVSLDGTKEMHDRHRKFANGTGSFDVVIQNLKRIRDRYPNYNKQIAINTVLSPSNSLDCIKKFYDTDEVLGFFDPKYSLVNSYGSKTPITYGEDYIVTSRTERLKALLWVAEKLPQDFVSSLFLTEKSMAQRNSEHLSPIDMLPEICHPGGPCLAGIKRLFCDVDGNFYPCERVSEESEVMKIGVLDTGIDIEKAKKLINIGEITKDACSSCWGFIHCNQCAVMADDAKGLSKELRLSRCANTKNNILEEFKTHCFLMEQGVDLNEWKEDDFDGEVDALPV